MALIETTPILHQLALSKITDNIPPEFVRSPDEQPGITTLRGPSPKVPTINLEASDEELVEEIGAASREWGMFQVVNHGIPAEVIMELQRVGRMFFQGKEREKERRFLYNEIPKDVDGKKTWVDHLFHEIWPPNAVNYNSWPQNPTSYRSANEEYAKLLRGVATRLLRCLSRGLGLGDEELEKAIGGDEIVYMMKINYYPPCPRPDLALGVAAHTDMSALTILVPNHVQGLQAFKDEHWINVEYIPNALVIHIGDQMEIVSNGKYKSVLHRTTVNKEETRMSWPVFVEPPADHTVSPIPKFVTDEEPTKYKSKKYSDYKHCKLNNLPQ